MGAPSPRILPLSDTMSGVKRGVNPSYQVYIIKNIIPPYIIKKIPENFYEYRSIYNKIYIMRNRLTERDLSRIVRRVINEDPEGRIDPGSVIDPDGGMGFIKSSNDKMIQNKLAQKKYCDIESETYKQYYDNAQSYIDKLVKSENISYDCDFHKHFLRQMLIGDLCTMWEQQMVTRLPKGIDPRDVYKFLKSRYRI